MVGHVWRGLTEIEVLGILNDTDDAERIGLMSSYAQRGPLRHAGAEEGRAIASFTIVARRRAARHRC